jgi:hypothetical protein
MNHFNESSLQAYLDNELSSSEREQASRHLQQCNECNELYRQMEERSLLVREKLQSIAPAEFPGMAETALAHFLRRQSEPPESVSLFHVSRPVWAFLSAAVVLVAVWTIQPVRAWAIDFLRLFRVQKITVVPVDPDNMQKFHHDFFGSDTDTRMDQLFSENANVVRHGKPQNVATLEDAARLSGFGLRLPDTFHESAQFHVRPAVDFSFVIDLQRIRDILQDAGRSDIRLSDHLDGRTISAAIPSSVVAIQGDCPGKDESLREYPGCRVLMQIPSPTVSAPPDINLPEVAQAMFELLGVTPEDAKRLSETIDWTSTLVLPVPVDRRVRYSEVQVDGVNGVLIQRNAKRLEPSAYHLLWVKDGILFALMGQGTGSDAVALADTMR